MVNNTEGLTDLAGTDLMELLERLRQGDFQTRWDAAKQLESWGESCIPPLLRLLATREGDEELAWFIARILGALPHPDGILALVQLLERSEDEAVCLAAAQGLARLGPIALERLAPLQQDGRRQATVLRALVQIQHPDVVPLLIEAAPTASAELRSLIFDALAPFAHPQIVPLLLEGLQDPTATVRRAAIASLGGQARHSTEWLQPVLACLKDADAGVVAEAARTLGRHPTPAIALALTERCCHPQTPPSLQQVFIQTLGWIGSAPSVGGLLEIWQGLAAQHPLPLPQMQDLLLSLGKVKDATLRPQIVTWAFQQLRSPLLQPHPDLRSRILLLLGQLAHPTDFPPLIDCLADPDERVRLHSIAALKHIDPQAAYQAIQTRLQNEIAPDLRAKLALALQEWH